MDVILMLCINDDNGNPSGRINKLDVELGGDPLALTLESKFFPDGACACRIDAMHVHLSRRAWPIKSHGSWVGNIYWDAITLDVADANALLNYARERDVFTVDGGWVDLGDMWDDLSQPIDLAKVVTE